MTEINNNLTKISNEEHSIEQTGALFHIHFLQHLAQDPDICQIVYYKHPPETNMT